MTKAKMKTAAEVKTLIEMIRNPARETPGALAIELLDHQGVGSPMTYGELWSAAMRVAGSLTEQGLRPGERVLTIYPTGREFILSFFGTLLAGGVPVPFTPPFGLAKVETYLPSFEAIVKDATPRMCLTTSKLALVLRPSVDLLPVPMKLMAFDPATAETTKPFGEVEAQESDLAFLQYTSGSTSQPKGVMLTHGNLIANIRAFTGALGICENDVAVSWLPLFHDMGLIGMLLGSLHARIPLILLSPESFIRSPDLWMRAITQYRGTLTAAPNFAFHYCVKRIEEERLSGYDLRSVRAMLNGAEPVDVDAVKSFQAHFSRAGLREKVILPVYGLAESSLAVTFPELGEVTTETVDAELLESSGLVKAPRGGTRSKVLVSVGKPLMTQQVRIADDDNRALGERQIGEILVKGPSVMQGYYRKTKETAAALQDGWLRTGDYGFVAGGNLYITGRKKDLIIRRGRNYFPQDIEAVVNEVDGVRKGRAVAFAIEKEGSETEVVIVAETRVKGAAALEKLVGGVKVAVAKAFPFSPIDVKLVGPGTIPRTSSGKVRRQPCKDMYLRGALKTRKESVFAMSRGMIVSIVTAQMAHLARRLKARLAQA